MLFKATSLKIVRIFLVLICQHNSNDYIAPNCHILLNRNGLFIVTFHIHSPGAHTSYLFWIVDASTN